MRRRMVAGVVAAVSVLALPACGERDTTTEKVRAAIGRTADLASEFLYVDERPDPDGDSSQLQVLGVVEDDFRYKAQVSYDGEPGYEQVVHDDALAMRFLEPARIDGLIERNLEGEVDTETELEGVDVLDALASRRWVLDPTGAPPPTSSSVLQRDLGTDPVFDAVTALSYVERAVNESSGVSRWSPDDITPTYAASEDVFPKPDEGSDVIRYDVERPSLPAVSAASGDGGGVGGEQQILATRHFRKMAIYVQDDRVIQVIERVETIGKQLRDFVSYTKKLLKESKAPQQFQDAFAEMTDRDDIPEQLLGTRLLHFANIGLEQFGQEPILVRNMSLELTGLDEDHIVTLPQGEDVIAGPLAILVSSGRAKAAAVESGGATTDESGGATSGADEGEGGDGGEGGGGSADEPIASGGEPPAGAEPVGDTGPSG